MRQVILDTETTGLDPALGHRIIEIAAIEVANRRRTERKFHSYVNPERDSDEAALQVHGLTREFLSDKPKFVEIAKDFLEFVSGAELIIHNAAFDLAFVDYELSLLKLEPLAKSCATVTDTLRLAKDIHPGKRNNLDMLCERYQVDRSARTLHGALLDAQLLTDVYLAMTRGQESLIIEEETLQITIEPTQIRQVPLVLTVVAAGADEVSAHEVYLADLAKGAGGVCLWQLSAPTNAAMHVARVT